MSKRRILRGITVLVSIALLALGAWYAKWSYGTIGRNETSAVGALRAYCSAQERYSRQRKGPGGVQTFADSPGKLSQAGLIPAEVSAARGHKGVPYRGYLFLEGKSIAGVNINWKLDYMLTAIPAGYGTTGRRVFVVCTNGTVFGYDMGPKVKFRDDYPADPANDPLMVQSLIDDPWESGSPPLQFIFAVIGLVALVFIVPIVLFITRAKTEKGAGLEARKKR